MDRWWTEPKYFWIYKEILGLVRSSRECRLRGTKLQVSPKKFSNVEKVCLTWELAPVEWGEGIVLDLFSNLKLISFVNNAVWVILRGIITVRTSASKTIDAASGSANILNSAVEFSMSINMRYHERTEILTSRCCIASPFSSTHQYNLRYFRSYQIRIHRNEESDICQWSTSNEVQFITSW